MGFFNDKQVEAFETGRYILTPVSFNSMEFNPG